jgi:cytochrome c556
MRVFLFILVLASCDAAAAFAGPIEDRQALMKSFALSLKNATSLSRGNIPYDAALSKVFNGAAVSRG